jgi:hypothetical protein
MPFVSAGIPRELRSHQKEDPLVLVCNEDFMALSF